MKRIKDVNIGIRLNVVLGVAMVVIVGLLGWDIIYQEKAEIIELTDIRMHEQVADLSQIIENEITEHQEKVNIGLQFTTE